MNELKLKNNWILTEGKAWGKMDMYADVHKNRKGSPFSDENYLLIDENNQAYITTEYCWFVHYESESMTDFLEFDCKKVNLDDYLKK